MITNSKGKYLPYQIKTTLEAINSLDEIEKKIYHYLVKIGDVEIIDNLSSFNLGVPGNSHFSGGL